MKEKTKKIILIIIMFIFVLAFLETISFAGDGDLLITERYYTSFLYDDAAYLFAKTGRVIRVLRNIAVIASVIVLSITGLKYMLGSVEEKSEYKKTMVPIVIGCILVCSISTILTAISSVFS